MSTRNLRKRKIPVEPVLQNDEIKIKTELDDGAPAAPQKRATVKKSKHKITSKVKAEVKIKVLQGSNVKDCTCKYCQQVFENAIDRLRHSRSCHDFPMVMLLPDEIEKYFDSPDITQCPICYKPLKTRKLRSVFIKHLLIHTLGINHQCSVCKKIFRRKEDMRVHEKRHIVSV